MGRSRWPRLRRWCRRLTAVVAMLLAVQAVGVMAAWGWNRLNGAGVQVWRIAGPPFLSTSAVIAVDEHGNSAWELHCFKIYTGQTGVTHVAARPPVRILPSAGPLWISEPNQLRTRILGTLLVVDWNHAGGVFDVQFRLPWWQMLLAPVVVTGLWWLQRDMREFQGLCRRCGYDVRASPQRCPECGQAVPQPPVPAASSV